VETIAEFAQHGSALGLFDAGLTVERYRAIAAATAMVKREGDGDDGLRSRDPEDEGAGE
jgi:hypothetical protein